MNNIRALILIFLVFSGCKRNVNQKQLHTPEMMMEQTVSSIVFPIPDSIETPALIYRYSDNMCEGCIFEDIENLKVFQKKIGKDRILVLPAFSSRSRVRMRYELADFNHCNISSDSLVVTQQQFFAVINSNGKVEMIFFPRMGYSSLTQAYFNEVEKRLQK